MNVLEINNAFFNPKYRLVYITFQVKLRFLFWILEILKCSQKSLDYLAKVLSERAQAFPNSRRNWQCGCNLLFRL